MKLYIQRKSTHNHAIEEREYERVTKKYAIVKSGQRYALLTAYDSHHSSVEEAVQAHREYLKGKLEAEKGHFTGLKKNIAKFDSYYPMLPPLVPPEVKTEASTTPRNPSPTRNKVYLGDGVYVTTNEDGQIVLTAENGLYATDVIYLEPEVFDTLQKYVKAWKQPKK